MTPSIAYGGVCYLLNLWMMELATDPHRLLSVYFCVIFVVKERQGEVSQPVVC